MAEIQQQTDAERQQSDKTVQSVIEEAERLSNPALKPEKRLCLQDKAARVCAR